MVIWDVAGTGLTCWPILWLVTVLFPWMCGVSQVTHKMACVRLSEIQLRGQIIRGAVEGKEQLFYKDVYLDIYQLIEIVASLPQVDEGQLASYGASQGGALALVAAGLNPRIKRTVAIYPFLSDFRRVLEIGNTSEAYDELFRYFKFHDPFHETEEQIMEHLAISM